VARRRKGRGRIGEFIRHGSVTQWIVFVVVTWAVLLTVAIWFARPFTRRELFLTIAGEFIATSVMAILVGPAFKRAVESFTALRAHVEATAGEYSSFPDVRTYFTKLAGAHSHIRILDTFSFLIEPAHALEFRAAVTNALRKYVNVRILLVAPDSEAAAARRKTLSDGEAGVPIEVFDENLASNLSTLSQMLADRTADAPGKLEVKLYKVDPAVAYHRIDETALISFYPVGARAERSPQLEATVASPFGSMVDRRFEEIWHDLESVPLLDYYTCTVHVRTNGQTRSFRQIGFVRIDEDRFLATRDFELVSAIFNSREASVTWTDDGTEAEYTVAHIDDDSARTRVHQVAVEKYGARESRQYFLLKPRDGS
jgi:hypothetical protein